MLFLVFGGKWILFEFITPPPSPHPYSSQYSFCILICKQTSILKKDEVEQLFTPEYQYPHPIIKSSQIQISVLFY